jgi:hypothetical protein
VKRIAGASNDQETVYAKAEVYCQQQEAKANMQVEASHN